MKTNANRPISVTLIAVCAVFTVLVKSEAQERVTQPGATVVRSYRECVSAGGRVSPELEGAKCVSKDGVLFFERTEKPERPCVDKCGDGICQEMVCMALGCPCAESKQSCPKDCK
jgi:hypothetical protein